MNKFWKSHIPDGEINSAKVETFEVAKDCFFGFKQGILPGQYKRLFVDGKLMMSDTPKEWRDHYPIIKNAKGKVLLNGLGLGCCLNVILNKSEVESVVVVELNKDVIDLVGKHFNHHSNLTIIHADAREWRPPKGERFNAVWHDIWPDICLDNLDEMIRFHRSYGRRTDWQGSWSRNELNYRKAREKTL